MQLSQSTRLDCDDCSSERFRDREVSGVHNLDGPAATWGLGRWFLRCKIYVRRIGAGRQIPIRTRHHAVTDIGRQDIRIRLGSIVENGGVDAKVLRKNVFGRMRDPVIDHKRCPSGVEISVVKDEQIFVLVRKAVNRVSDALREIPNISHIESAHLVEAVFVDCGYQYATGIDVAPFGNTMPV